MCVYNPGATVSRGGVLQGEVVIGERRRNSVKVSGTPYIKLKTVAQYMLRCGGVRMLNAG
jgi:hypothetical protein